MNRLLNFSLGLLLLGPLVGGCGSNEPTVIEPTNEDQLQLMRDMVAGETQAVDDAETQRDK